MVKGVLIKSLALVVLTLVFCHPGSAQVSTDIVVPPGWEYSLFADVDGIQNVAGPSSPSCPVGAYTTSVDDLGHVYFATSSCNVGNYYIIRVAPDGSAWSTFGNQSVPDLDGVFAHTNSAGAIFVYGGGDSGVSKFDASGALVRRYVGIRGNGQLVAVDSREDIFVSTIYNGVYKIAHDTGAVTPFVPASGDMTIIAIDTSDNLYVRAYNRSTSNPVSRILKVAPDGTSETIFTFSQNTGSIAVHPDGDLYMVVSGSILRLYQNYDGTWDYSEFASGIAGSLAWSRDGNTLYISAGANRKIYTLTKMKIQATIDLDPDVINKKSKGKFVTCYIELAEGYAVQDIDISTVQLNGTLTALASPFEIGDHDNDGIADLMVKFDRQSVQDLLPAEEYVEFTVSGSLADGTLFEGTDKIWVRDTGVEHINDADPSSVIE